MASQRGRVQNTVVARELNNQDHLFFSKIRILTKDQLKSYVGVGWHSCNVKTTSRGISKNFIRMSEHQNDP